ncbi:hypothetical protein WL21_09790 [Burkholderia ubonensis]|uniref:TRADD-N-associated membrane domain-containing protein n=1 Tax=Burkholderia ubonensis TaxID=101571 RepID=UPI0007596B8A|nr:hypothetical protein [Burkholderia ubonensis]KVO83314.1 hypothetical protein WJ81_23010 [Burkholderia ubonensis]KVZ58961.1 hypothetical protein WL20_20410 [Burkholderia ubonensis]KVZ70589.1 hypothetical protein WL21_09790 [Burkholderia ubonensis]
MLTIAADISPFIGIAAGALAVVTKLYIEYASSKAGQKKVESVERKAAEHPEKPQLAWEVARTKLENYLDRNLAQVRSILWLTYLVMFAGFSLVLFGLYRALDAQNNLPVAVVGAASGVIITFIGGSFLVIYRSILAQSKGYVTVLERINAVGMAVQVLSNIPEDQAELKHKTTAQLATSLIQLYGERPAVAATSTRTRKPR